MNSFSRDHSSLKRQRGVATILLMLLTGLALTVVVASVMYSVRGAQDKTLAVHASTQAQQRAWGGVEYIRSYLAGLDGETLATLGGELAITGVDNLQAEIAGPVIENAGAYQIPVSITGIAASGSAAQTTSTLVVTFEVEPGSSGSQALLGDINIYSDLNVSGNITVKGGENVVMNVDGEVNLSGSVSGVQTIQATGDINISSGISVERIHSNGNVTLSGSANVDVITAMGDVTLSGGTKAGTIRANGDVLLSGGSSSATSIESQGNVTLSGGSARADTVLAEGYVSWTSSASASEIKSNSWVQYNGGPNAAIYALGDVTMTGAGAGSVTSQGNVSITYGTLSRVDASGSLTSTGGNVSAGTIGGSKSCPSWNNCPGVKVVSGHTAEISPITVTAVTEYSSEQPTVDAYALKSQANLIFEINQDGLRTVTVKNYNGIAPGTYFLGDYKNGGYKDYLCTEVTAGKNNTATCTSPATPYKTICKGYSTYNGCVSYSSKDSKWTLAGVGFAPGVLWFEGSLAVTNGTYFNTMVATGNINTSGSTTLYAVNYAGQSPICNNQFEGTTISSLFADYSPQAFCSNGVFTSQPIGNVALMAGSYSGSDYVGGDINLGASNDVYGSVVAGNLLTTGGSTKVHGSVTVAALRTPGSTVWSGSTLLDFTNLPEGYDPDQMPCTDDCEASESTVKYLWGRYD